MYLNGFIIEILKNIFFEYKRKSKCPGQNESEVQHGMDILTAGAIS